MEPTTDDPTTMVGALFVRNAEAARGYALGLVGGDHALADDLVQEAYLVIARRAADYRPEADFGRWLRGILRKLALAAYRKAGRRPLLDADLLDLVAASAPADDAWSAHRHALARCLGHLTGRSRELVDLRYGAGLMPTAIARHLGWTVNAINVALSRLRRRLRACCDRELEPQP